METPVSSQHKQQEPSLPLHQKAEGAFLALAAGDALGWPQEMPRSVRRAVSGNPHMEFAEWTRRGGGRFRPFEEVIHAGDYSDDTQLTLAVARSRANHGPAWWKAFTRTELPLWMLYERGGGGATKRAAAAWVNGHPPWKSSRKNGVRQYFNAGGNGVAMRVLPHALFFAEEGSAATLIHDVVLDGSATHGHPRALVGAAVYAYTAWCLVRNRDTLRFGELLDLLIDQAAEWSKLPKSEGQSSSWFEAAEGVTNGCYSETWEKTACEMRELLQVARKGLQAGALADDHSILKDLGCFGRTKGAGTSSAAAAAYLAARYAAQPVQGVLRAAFEKGADTDTLAAMVGGLMGCLAGIEWLPSPWLRVQDAKYLRTLATQIIKGPNGARQNPVKSAPPPQSILSELAGNGGQCDLNLGSMRARAVTLPRPKPIVKSISVSAWKLATHEGQTLYVNKVKQLAKKVPANRSIAKAKSDEIVSPKTHLGEAVDSNIDAKEVLYATFCKQLRTLPVGNGIRPMDVEARMGLVRSQAAKWLERAEKENLIQRISKKPAKFALKEHQLC